MEKAAKAAFVGYNVLQFCEAPRRLLLFQSVADFDFRLFTQIAHQRQRQFCIVLRDALYIAFSALSGMAPAFTSSTPAERRCSLHIVRHAINPLIFHRKA